MVLKSATQNLSYNHWKEKISNKFLVTHEQVYIIVILTGLKSVIDSSLFSFINLFDIWVYKYQIESMN